MSEQLRLFKKVAAKEPLTADEASYVWSTVAGLFRESGLTGFETAYDQLARELVEGKRCGVCGEYESTDCWEVC